MGLIEEFGVAGAALLAHHFVVKTRYWSWTSRLFLDICVCRNIAVPAILDFRVSMVELLLLSIDSDIFTWQQRAFKFVLHHPWPPCFAVCKRTWLPVCCKDWIRAFYKVALVEVMQIRCNCAAISKGQMLAYGLNHSTIIARKWCIFLVLSIRESFERLEFRLLMLVKDASRSRFWKPIRYATLFIHRRFHHVIFFLIRCWLFGAQSFN